MAKRTAQDIRRRNRFDALRCVFAAPGPVSRQEIAAATGLSFATVANLVAELLEAGVLREAGHEDSKGGRPRARLAVNAERGALVGIDVAETSLRGRAVRPGADGAARRAAAAAADRRPAAGRGRRHRGGGVEGLSDSTVEAPRILGAGVSVPGLVEREGGVSVFSPYWSWRDVPLRSLLAERLTMPLYLDNPLKAGTVAEMWFGAGREVDDLVVLTLRAGVGAGIAVDGALYRGATNSAGEWGHTCLVRGGRACRCGRQGCVEAYVSSRGIADTVRELDAESPLLDPDEDVVVTKVARAAAEGDAVARRSRGADRPPPGGGRGRSPQPVQSADPGTGRLGGRTARRAAVAADPRRHRGARATGDAPGAHLPAKHRAGQSGHPRSRHLRP
ncbi:hypothetical protein GCM10020254_03630 [Streptomyces goshikiensis]